MTAQGNTVIHEEVIAVLSLSSSAASASVGALLVLSFRPKSRGWLFWKSGDAYSS